jgi:hypothetical protein
LAGHEIKKKGLLPGAIHVGLDVTPVVGTAKNVIEIVTGDWIPDKAPADPKLLTTDRQPEAPTSDVTQNPKPAVAGE